MAEKQTITILQADGLYPDSSLEETLFAPSPTQSYTLSYHSGNLWPPGHPTPLPWSSLPAPLRTTTNGILVLKLPFTAADIPLFPNLKVIVRMGVGYDRLDRPALAAAGITVCNVPDYGTNEIADHAMALVLALRRGVLLHHDRQRGEAPAPWMQVESALIRRLQGAVFGVVGVGRIGMATVLRAKSFGFRVVVFDPYVANGLEKSLQVERVGRVEEVFERADVVSLHCPCTRETRGWIGRELLGRMKVGSVLVNTARGEILDLDAVEEGLRSGRLSGVGLDVLPEEPIPEDDDQVHELIKAYRRKEEWLEGRMVLTCHTAFYSPESFVDIRVKSIETMRNVLIDGGKSNIITPEME